MFECRTRGRRLSKYYHRIFYTVPSEGGCPRSWSRSFFRDTQLHWILPGNLLPMFSVRPLLTRLSHFCHLHPVYWTCPPFPVHTSVRGPVSTVLCLPVLLVLSPDQTPVYKSVSGILGIPGRWFRRGETEGRSLVRTSTVGTRISSTGD